MGDWRVIAMVPIFIAIFFISLILAIRSMKDLDIPQEIRRMLQNRKIKGTILIMKDKVTHYSSTSSSSG